SRVGIGELIEARTPASLAVLLYRSGSSTPANTDLFEELRRVPGSSPVIMLAPGGGNLLAYDALIRSLDEDQAIVGFRLPGADGRSDPVSTIVEQADRILPQLLAMVPPADGFELVGWSTGGLLALELANRLESEGYPVAFIAMIDTIYPGFQMASQPGKADKYRRLFTDGGVSAVRDHARHRLAIRIRESKEMARMRLAERTRDNVDAKVIERQLFEIAFAAAESYRPRVFDGPVVFYGASGTDTARTVVPWGEHFARVEVVIVEGEHAEENAILDAERVGPLARHLQKLLTANH
ncbi:MAG: thioesterase domain-containing protein, partial [Acidimicrobiales bacterium]